MVGRVEIVDENALLGEEAVYEEDVSGAAVSELSSSEYIGELCSEESDDDEGVVIAGELAVILVSGVNLVVVMMVVGVLVDSS